MLALGVQALAAQGSRLGRPLIEVPRRSAVDRRLLVWYDAQQETPVSDNTPIVPKDWGPAGNNGTVSDFVTLGAPYYLSTGLNGKPCFKFDRTRGFHATNKIPLLGVSDSCIFIVFKGWGVTGYLAGHLYFHGDTLSSALSHMATSSAAMWTRRNPPPGDDVVSSYNSQVGDWGLSIGPTVVRHDYKGTHATHKLYFNGTEQVPGAGVISSGNAGDPGTAPEATLPGERLCIGCRTDSQTVALKGYIGEFRYYQPRPSDAEISAIETVIRGNWGL